MGEHILPVKDGEKTLASGCRYLFPQVFWHCIFTAMKVALYLFRFSEVADSAVPSQVPLIRLPPPSPRIAGRRLLAATTAFILQR